MTVRADSGYCNYRISIQLPPPLRHNANCVAFPTVKFYYSINHYLRFIYATLSGELLILIILGNSKGKLIRSIFYIGGCYAHDATHSFVFAIEYIYGHIHWKKKIKVFKETCSRRWYTKHFQCMSHPLFSFPSLQFSTQLLVQ